jgi:NADH-quinone oxidoreductase subunit C
MAMSIRETTIQALSVLFPEEEKVEPQPVAVDGADTDESAPQEDTAGDEAAGEEVADGRIGEHDYTAKGYHLDVSLESEQLIQATGILFDLGYYLESITGVDWIKDDQLEVVYDFSRYDFDLCRVVFRVRLPRSEPHLPTITPIYTGANWHERETHDFFGIVFDGHPHLIPLLLPEDADFHPLLKDFQS